DNDYRFAYDLELVDEIGAGTALLSNSLPTRPQPFSHEATATFVEGALPEGRRRTQIAKALGIDPADGYALIKELGGDCSGAVAFLPEEQIDEGPGPESLQWLSEEELAEAVQSPSTLFSGEQRERVRFTLPGERHKLALVRDEQNNRWAWPTARAPSTHVIKPETGEYPEYVANEMFCMTVCRQVGLPVAKATVEEIGGRRCLVSPRYDRVAGDGVPGVRRLHCESFCQALGIPPGTTVDEQGEEWAAPGWAEARGLLNAVSRPDEVVNLLTAAFCNYILGNGDAHGNNFALIDLETDAPDGSQRIWRLAPLTDLTSTVVYDDPIHRGLVISEEYQETAYLLDLAEVCEDCEFDFEVMRGLASTTATRIGMAVETIATRSQKEGWHAPIIDKIVELAADRSFGVEAEVEY
ncbi:MAG: HipA domain-containing protein, partial [Solirubrobacterales bacterium]